MDLLPSLTGRDKKGLMKTLREICQTASKCQPESDLYLSGWLRFAVHEQWSHSHLCMLYTAQHHLHQSPSNSTPSSIPGAWDQLKSTALLFPYVHCWLSSTSHSWPADWQWAVKTMVIAGSANGKCIIKSRCLLIHGMFLALQRFFGPSQRIRTYTGSNLDRL